MTIDSSLRYDTHYGGFNENGYIHNSKLTGELSHTI